MEIDLGEDFGFCKSHDLITDLFVGLAHADGVARLQAKIDRGFDINTTDLSGRTVLTHAVHCVGTCKKGKLRERMLAGIICLMQNGANVNIVDQRGDTALSLALKFRQGDLAMLFFVHGAYAGPAIH